MLRLPRGEGVENLLLTLTSAHLNSKLGAAMRGCEMQRTHSLARDQSR